jgi:hypothetical protein
LCLSVCARVCVCVFVYVCICVCVCVYVYQIVPHYRRNVKTLKCYIIEKVSFGAV